MTDTPSSNEPERSESLEPGTLEQKGTKDVLARLVDRDLKKLDGMLSPSAETEVNEAEIRKILLRISLLSKVVATTAKSPKSSDGSEVLESLAKASPIVSALSTLLVSLGLGMLTYNINSQQTIQSKIFEAQKVRSQELEVMAKYQDRLDKAETRGNAILTIMSGNLEAGALLAALNHPEDGKATAAAIVALGGKPGLYEEFAPRLLNNAVTDLERRIKSYDAELTRLFEEIKTGIDPKLVHRAIDAFKTLPLFLQTRIRDIPIGPKSDLQADVKVEEGKFAKDYPLLLAFIKTHKPEDLFLKWRLLINLLESKKDFFSPESLALLENSKIELEKMEKEYDQKRTFGIYIDLAIASFRLDDEVDRTKKEWYGDKVTKQKGLKQLVTEFNIVARDLIRTDDGKLEQEPRIRKLRELDDLSQQIGDTIALYTNADKIMLIAKNVNSLNEVLQGRLGIVK
jgi:hypothetical protein